MAKLSWKPPALYYPSTISLPAKENTRNGFRTLSLSTTRDYIIQMPSSKRVGGIFINGGRNVRLIGGHTTANPLQITDPADWTSKAVMVKNSTGIVHIEGLLIDTSAGGVMDAFQAGPLPGYLQIQNCRVENLFGHEAGYHADVVQLIGEIGGLRVDYLTGTTNYQGLQLDRWGFATIKHTNIKFKEHPTYPGYKGARLVFLTDGYSCAQQGRTLEEVYIEPAAGKAFGDSVWPRANSSLSCDAAISKDGNIASWPALEAARFRGVVRRGSPPNGDFVPVGVAGIGYRSTGYL